MDVGQALWLPLNLTGWRFEGTKPPERRYVLLAFPHTTNWDGLLLVALTQRIGLHLSWMIKDEWTRGPAGGLLRRVGAIGIDRSKSHHVVDAMIDQFKRSDELVLGIPPEGTRHRTEYWKSGFYHIALGASVPVVPGYIDYSRKRGGLGPALHMTGDVRADMDRIRAFYAEKAPVARFPENVGPIRLREENAKASP